MIFLLSCANTHSKIERLLRLFALTLGKRNLVPRKNFFLSAAYVATEVAGRIASDSVPSLILELLLTQHFVLSQNRFLSTEMFGGHVLDLPLWPW